MAKVAKYEAQDEVQKNFVEFARLVKIQGFKFDDVSLINVIKNAYGNSLLIVLANWNKDWAIDRLEVFDHSYDRVSVFRDLPYGLVLKGYLSRQEIGELLSNTQYIGAQEGEEDDDKGKVLLET